MSDARATIRFIYFDLGNVILHFNRDTAYRQLAEISGVSPERVREILEDEGLQVRYEVGELSSAEYHECFCGVVGRQLDRGDLIEAGSAMFRANVPLIPMITQLVAANHRLGILSNTCEAHWEYCHDGRFGILRHAFDVHVLSYRVRAMKPDPKIYEAAVTEAAVLPREVFFVDDLPDNVAAARQYGIDAVQFTTVSQLASDLRQRGVQFNY